MTGRPRRRSSERNERDPIGRAFDLLEAFPDTPITLSELARRAGLSKTTAHRLVAQLIRHDAVERGPGGLRLGPRLFELGQRVAPLQALRGRAAGALHELLAVSGETVHLAVRDGGDVVYVEKLVGPHGTLAPSRCGQRMALQHTAVGKALVAFLPRAERHEVLGSDGRRLDADLADARRRGVAVSIEELRPGLVCVGAPILDGDGRPVAALSIAGRRGRVGRNSSDAVRSAAQRLSRAMAATG